MATASQASSAGSRWIRYRRRTPPGWRGVAVSAVIATLLLAPLVLIGLDARSAGWSQLHAVLFRSRTAFLLGHTILLCAIVAVCATIIGTGAAWLTERAALPARRLWIVLLVLPVAMPDFVVGYAWHSFAPTLNPLLGASLVMTLGTYPLVYLPVAAALRRADPGAEETAHVLGVGRLAAFRRVTLPLAANGGARRRGAGHPDRAVRVRGVRDPALSDVHYRDLQRVSVRLAGRRCALDPARAAGIARAADRWPRPAADDLPQRTAPFAHPGAARTDGGPDAARVGRVDRARDRRSDRDDRLLDDEQPAHDAAGDRDARECDLDDARATAPGGPRSRS